MAVDVACDEPKLWRIVHFADCDNTVYKGKDLINYWNRVAEIRFHHHVDVEAIFHKERDDRESLGEERRMWFKLSKHNVVARRQRDEDLYSRFEVGTSVENRSDGYAVDDILDVRIGVQLVDYGSDLWNGWFCREEDFVTGVNNFSTYRNEVDRVFDKDVGRAREENHLASGFAARLPFFLNQFGIGWHRVLYVNEGAFVSEASKHRTNITICASVFAQSRTQSNVVRVRAKLPLSVKPFRMTKLKGGA